MHKGRVKKECFITKIDILRVSPLFRMETDKSFFAEG